MRNIISASLVVLLVATSFALSGFKAPLDNTLVGKDNHDDILSGGVFAEVPRFVGVASLTPTLSAESLEVDLRPWCPPIYNQRHLGSCTAFASVKGIMEIERRKDLRPAPEMSALYFYYYERAEFGGEKFDSGARMVDAASVMLERGCATEESYPYVIPKFAEKPPKKLDAEAGDYRIKGINRHRSLDAIVKELDNGHPVMGGILILSSFVSMDVVTTGMVPIPDPLAGDDMLGAHAIAIVGYDADSRHFLVRNSWGQAWGDKGYCYIPYDYIARYGFDYFSIRLWD
jgi:C1A family cysteine protease